MDQPNKDIFQELKQLWNLHICADAPEVQLCLQGCTTFKGSSVAAYLQPRTQTEILLQSTVLSTAFLMDISASSITALAQFLWYPSEHAVTEPPYLPSTQKFPT